MYSIEQQLAFPWVRFSVFFDRMGDLWVVCVYRIDSLNSGVVATACFPEMWQASGWAEIAKATLSMFTIDEILN